MSCSAPGRWPRLTRVAASLLGASLLLAPVGTLAAQAPPLTNAALGVDSLLASPGPAWLEARSAHFVVHFEPVALPPLAAGAFLDSLETAWATATTLIGETPKLSGLVVGSAARFPRMLSPISKGLTFPEGPGHGATIILVHNDSVRAYARHEVMHVVSMSAWGRDSLAWVAEGVATWADGRCQGTTTLAVARDALRAEPRLSVRGLTPTFFERVQLSQGERARVYAIAASFVAFTYARGGRAAVHDLWQKGLPPASSRVFPADTLDAAWRAWVERASAGQPSLTEGALARRGCG